ncbi:hypothetical protein ABT224_27490 [Streptomyces sp. NPDC001584]|uniref:hypothetical protein n=1 Tax=Streptomyces sp. NPDC001584 TaxID=3154521 RepID=UPI003333764F
MAVREIRAAAHLIGRRNALRYLAIGVGASLVAACGGKGEDAPAGASALGATVTSPPAPVVPAPASSGPVARAFDAFIGGTWKRNSIGPLALGIGPWLVTAPLLLLPVGPFVPHAWIAGLMSLPGEAQYRLYFWVQATGRSSSAVGAALVAGFAAAAAFLAQLLLRSERVLRPID